MAKYRVSYDKDGCIGAFACFAVAPEFWTQDNTTNKVDLKDATFNEQTNRFELIIDEKDLQLMQDSADVCPVKVIIIEKIE